MKLYLKVALIQFGLLFIWVNNANAESIFFQPWRYFNVDPSKRAETRELTNKVYVQWKNTVGDRLVNLAEDPETRNEALNVQRKNKSVFKGADNLNLEYKIALEPIACQLGSHLGIFLQIYFAESGELLASHHQITELKLEELNEVQLQTMLLEVTRAAINDLEAKLVAPTDALHVAVRPQSRSTRIDQPNHHCLNLLLEEQLVARYTMTRSVGIEGHGHLRYVNSSKEPYRRATRTIVLSWGAAEKIDEGYSWDAHYFAFESVFGRRITDNQNIKPSLTFNPPRAVLDLPPDLEALLAEQEKSLALDEMPRISHIYGAWIYLDRGRAWGLHMNDRLVSAELPEDIKGHVVQYFGPEARLVSPSGFPIHEGAIVYIRKGQGKTQIGMPFTFDTKTYPAAWPPQ